MTFRLGRPMILTALAGLASACAIDVSDDSHRDDADVVRMNAEEAVRQCGEGRVKSVGLDGFACKAAGE